MDFYTKLGARIKEIREEKGLTQQQLAQAINISRTAMSQIELGNRKLCIEEAANISKVFNVSLHELIDPSKEIKVIIERASKVTEPETEIRVNVPQNNLAKFKEVVLYILTRVGSKPNIGETVLYKLLYFIDFNFYEKYEEQLIGAAYIKNAFGPTPVAYAKIADMMIKEKELEKIVVDYHGYSQTRYIALREPDLSVLNAREVKLIDDVLNRLSDMSAKQISEYSHNDIPWITTEDGKLIEYESVFYRTPVYSVRQYDDEI